MSRETLLAGAAGAVAGLFLIPALAIHPAAAAQLHVTAAPLQTWKVAHGLPEVPVAPEDVVAAESVEEEPDSTESESGAEPGAGHDGDHQTDGGGQATQPNGPGTPPEESPTAEPPAEEPDAPPAADQPADATADSAQQPGERVAEVTQDVAGP